MCAVWKSIQDSRKNEYFLPIIYLAVEFTLKWICAVFNKIDDHSDNEYFALPVYFAVEFTSI
jgi:hypothetical protein